MYDINILNKHTMPLPKSIKNRVNAWYKAFGLRSDAGTHGKLKLLRTQFPSMIASTPPPKDDAEELSMREYWLHQCVLSQKGVALNLC